jgi:hypothetical protein
MPALRRSLPFFLALGVCLAAWQVWLTWKLTGQDRNLQLQRSREHLSQVADLVVAQLEALRPLSARDATRTEALLRIARLERKLGQPEAALAAYERLSQEATLSPGGVPYALMAAAAHCRMLVGPPESPKAAPNIESLRQALLEGRCRCGAKWLSTAGEKSTVYATAGKLAFASHAEPAGRRGCGDRRPDWGTASPAFEGVDLCSEIRLKTES